MKKVRVGYEILYEHEEAPDIRRTLREELEVENAYIDRLNRSLKTQTKLNQVMELLREGDAIVVRSLDRFAPSLKELFRLFKLMEQKRIQFISQHEGIDTKSKDGMFLASILPALANLENGFIQRGYREEVESMRGQGVGRGRPRVAINQFEIVYRDWKEKQITTAQAIRLCNISSTTFHRKVKEYEHSRDT